MLTPTNANFFMLIAKRMELYCQAALQNLLTYFAVKIHATVWKPWNSRSLRMESGRLQRFFFLNLIWQGRKLHSCP